MILFWLEKVRFVMSLPNVGSMSSYLKHEHNKIQFKIKIDIKAGRIYIWKINSLFNQ